MNHFRLFIFKSFIIILFLFTVSACSTSKSIKQINTIDKNTDYIQNEVKEVKNNIKKTKQAIIKIKQEQPVCNIKDIEDRIEILDIQTNSIDNNLSNVKQQIETSKDIIEAEVKEYRSKYHKSIVYIIMLITLLFLIVFNRIKININSMIEYIRNIFTWLKNKISRS